MLAKSKNNFLKLALIFIIIIGGIAYWLFMYNSNLRNDLANAASDSLAEVAEQQRFNVVSQLYSDIKSIESSAITLSYVSNDTDKLLLVANELVQKTNFEYLAITNTAGKGILNTRQAVDISYRPYFKKVLEGKTVLNDPIRSSVRDAMVIPLATPIYKNDEIIGVLVGTYTADKINNLILPSYNGLGYAYIVTQTGDILSKTNSEYALTKDDNLFRSLEKMEFHKYDSLETLYANVLDNKSGYTLYGIDGKNRLCHYAPLGLNGWYIFVVVPEDVISSDAARIIRQAAIMAFIIITLFAAFILYIILLQKKSEKIQKAHTKQLERIAFVDEITGAPTLAKFKMEAQRLLEENLDIPYILIKFDVDRFKLINQTYGYAEGDRVLKNITKALKSNIKSEIEAYARANIDEFIILHRLSEDDNIITLRDSFINHFYKHMGNELLYNVKFPTGCYVVEQRTNEKDILDAIEKANIAHKRAKQKGHELCIYDDVMKFEALEQQKIENKMEAALINEEFKVYLQPKYRLSDEKIAGAEALVRWISDTSGIIYPGAFIPIFEQNGFITKLDMYMFEHVCEIIKKWIDGKLNPVTVSVNFSRNHLNNPEFVKTLCAISDKYQIPHGYLEIELTETAIFDNEERISDVIEELHQSGFIVSMDDFGTGYSSLGLLKNLYVDIIKLDRSFFINAESEERIMSVISSIMDMTKHLGIHTVAEGVETKENIDLLRKLGCDMVQGYYYAKPMPEEEFLNKLQ